MLTDSESECIVDPCKHKCSWQDPYGTKATPAEEKREEFN